MLGMTFYLKETLPGGFSRIFSNLDNQSKQSQSLKSQPQGSDLPEYK